MSNFLHVSRFKSGKGEMVAVKHILQEKIANVGLLCLLREKNFLSCFIIFAYFLHDHDTRAAALTHDIERHFVLLF